MRVNKRNEPGDQLYMKQRAWLERELKAADEQATTAKWLADEVTKTARQTRDRADQLREHLNQLDADIEAGSHTFDTSDDKPPEE